MYVPPAFSEERLDVLQGFIRRHSFASVVTSGPDGPVASHVPVLRLSERGEYGSLRRTPFDVSAGEAYARA